MEEFTTEAICEINVLLTKKTKGRYRMDTKYIKVYSMYPFGSEETHIAIMDYIRQNYPEWTPGGWAPASQTE